MSLIVIGAGPGGTSAAISATLAGIESTILDVQPFPRPHVGESLHPAIQPLAAQLGIEDHLLAAGFTRYDGIWVQWRGARHFQPFGAGPEGAWKGFHAWRSDFDALLLERARELGVEVLQPCRAIAPILNAGRVIGVETSRGPLRAEFVIDAAGGNHWLARRLGLPIEHYSPRLLARFGYAPTCELSDGHLPSIMADNSGWTWYAKIRPELYHWTRLSFDAKFQQCHLANQSMRGADVTWRRVAKPAGLRYFCVGDAACVLDPASSHGVLRAVMTGIMAADVIKQITRQPARQRSLLDAYNTWLRDWFLHDVAKLRQLYRRLPYPPAWVTSNTDVFLR